MLQVDEIRKALWDDFSNLTDSEIEQIGIDILNFWNLMLDN